MQVIVDTCIWSLALRHKRQVPLSRHIETLTELILEKRAHLIGPIRQELLSGIADINQFNLLRDKLRGFLDLELLSADYETAAEYFNLTRAKGIQGSMIDFLICAVAVRYHMAIYTTDNDFTHYQKVLPIKLYQDGLRHVQ